MKIKKYVFKYDKENNLYCYAETNSKGFIVSYYHFYYKNNSLVQYDIVNQLRIINQYETPCKLVHRFEAGESWIKAVAVTDNAYQLSYPKIRKQFALNKENHIVKFPINQQLLNLWKEPIK